MIVALIGGFVLATLIGALIGASIAITAYKRGERDKRSERDIVLDLDAAPCPHCGAITPIEWMFSEPVGPAAS